MPELRKDPVVGRWVIISTERGRRPSDFPVEPVRPRVGNCVFCPGNEAKTPPEILANRPPDSAPNEPGWSLRVVPNKFPALRIEGELEPSGEGLYDQMNGVGAHEVVIETPQHDASLATLSTDTVADVLLAYRDRMVDLKKDPRFEYILVFKNHGAAAGAWPSYWATSCGGWTGCSTARRSTSCCTRRRCERARSSTSTGTWRSFPSSPTWPATSGAAASSSTPCRRKMRRRRCAKTRPDE